MTIAHKEQKPELVQESERITPNVPRTDEAIELTNDDTLQTHVDKIIESEKRK